jgi:signal peptidase I
MPDNRNFFAKLLYGGGVVYDMAKWLIIVAIILSMVNAYWYSIFIVDGVSMEPTILNGQLVLLNKVFYRSAREPERGESVVVEYPGDPQHKRYVKRVVGLPGEKVAVSNGNVYINLKKLTEPYLAFGTYTDQDGQWELKSNQFFLMGDNRLLSNDCRYFGPVEKRFFVGRASWVVYPGLKKIETPAYLNGYASAD